MTDAPIVPKDQTIKISTAVVLLILGIVLGFGIALIFSLFGMAVGYLKPGTFFSDWITKAGMLFGTIGFILPAWIYFKRSQIPPIPAFRFHRVTWITIAASFLFALGMVILTDALDKQIAPGINRFLDETIGTVIPELQSERIMKAMMEQFLFKNLLSAFLLVSAAVLAAAYCEEMVIRGFFQHALENRLKPAWAILISSIVFSMIHFNPWGGIQIFIVAIALGFIAFYTNSIVPTIIIHGLNNLIFILLVNIGKEHLSWYGTETSVHGPIVAAGFVLAIAGMALLIIGRRSSNPISTESIHS